MGPQGPILTPPDLERLRTETAETVPSGEPTVHVDSQFGWITRSITAVTGLNPDRMIDRVGCWVHFACLGLVPNTGDHAPLNGFEELTNAFFAMEPGCV